MNVPIEPDSPRTNLTVYVRRYTRSLRQCWLNRRLAAYGGPTSTKHRQETHRLIIRFPIMQPPNAPLIPYQHRGESLQSTVDLHGRDHGRFGTSYTIHHGKLSRSAMPGPSPLHDTSRSQARLLQSRRTSTPLYCRYATCTNATLESKVRSRPAEPTMNESDRTKLYTSGKFGVGHAGCMREYPATRT